MSDPLKSGFVTYTSNEVIPLCPLSMSPCGSPSSIIFCKDVDAVEAVLCNEYALELCVLLIKSSDTEPSCSAALSLIPITKLLDSHQVHGGIQRNTRHMGRRILQKCRRPSRPSQTALLSS